MTVIENEKHVIKAPEEPKDYTAFIDSTLKDTLKIGFRARAVIEMENPGKGEAHVKTRAERNFEYDQIQIHKINVRHGKMYRAKCITTSSLTDTLLIKLFFNVKAMNYEYSSLNVESVDTNKKRHSTIMKANTLKVWFSSPTISAEINIIPVINQSLSTEQIEANKNDIIKLFNSRIKQLSEILPIVVAAKLTTKNKKDFINTYIMALARQANGDNTEFDDMFDTPEQATLAKACIDLNL